MPVSVTLLGGFAATVDGSTVADTAWRLKKARELVKLLALARGHRLHREQAMDVLWRDLAPAAAANNLHQAVHVARRALGADAIDVRDEVLSLAAATSTSTRSSRRPRRRGGMRTPAAYRAALSLYGGELLPENRYDDWAETRREELADARRRARGGIGGARHDGAVRPAGRRELVRRPRPRARRSWSRSCRRTRLLTLVGRRRRRQDAARARARPRRSSRRTSRARRSSSSRRSRIRGSSRMRSRPRSTCVRCPQQELVDAVIDFLARARAAARARQLRARAVGDRRASRTRCSARRRS